MTYPKISSIREMLKMAVSENGDKCAFKYRRKGKKVKEVTFSEFYDDTMALGAGLSKLGIKSCHIACAAKNSYRWIVTYISTLQSSGVFVPVDKELPENDLVNVINLSDSKVVFYDSYVKDYLMKNAGLMKKVKYFVCLDKKINDGRFISYDYVLQLGRESGYAEFENDINEDKDSLKLLVFTSGTTGASKGVMLTENNLIAEVNNGLQVCHPLTVGLSVLPYCHTYACVVDILSSIHCRCTMCINTSIKQVLSDFRLFKPDYIIIVPLFAEMFINGIQRSIRKKGKSKKFEKGLLISRLLRKIGIDARRKIFSEIHEEFGGNLRLMICGGAAIRKELGEFFDDIGITLIGGYGITECAPLVSVNTFDDNSFESAGHRIPCVEWKIESPDEYGEGEILVKGANVMKGYYKDPDATAAAFDGKWFRTGDYGRITRDDRLIITGRKKNLIVLNNGKNVFPEEIENLIMGLDYITEVVVKSKKNSYGDETALVAEIYCEEGMPVLSDVEKDVDDALAQLPSYKHISEIVVRDTPFMKTTTRKIIRK